MDHPNRVLIAVITLFVVLVVSLGAGITSLVLINRVQSISEKNEDSIARTDIVAKDLIRLKSESDIANCVAANVGRAAVRNALKDSLLALVDPKVTLTPEQEARILLYNERVDSGLPFRDCSKKGIEIFLENQPPDPALLGP